MGHCLPWILLLTYMCYLGLSVGAVLWTSFGFSPLKPHNISDATYDERNDRQRGFYNFLFVFFSCGASAVVAALITLVGICSRSIFNTTMAFHGSLSLGILHMVMIVKFLFRRTVPGDSPAYSWSAEINGGFLGLCALQVVLDIIHLKWRKNTWITLNLKELFSLNSIFFTARTVLSGYLIDAFASDMLWHLTRYTCHQCPPWSFYFSVVAIGTCIVVNGQSLLSVYFGSLHRAFAILSSFLLTVVCGCLAVVNSPYFISSIYHEFIYSDAVFTFSLVLTIVHLVHLILLVVKPNGSICSLLEVMKKNLENLSVNVEGLTQQLQSSHSGSLNTKKKIHSHLISLFVSIVSLSLIASSYWWYAVWSKVLLVSMSSSLISRSLSAVLYEVITRKVYATSFQVLLVSTIEFIPVLVGAIGIFARGRLMEIFGGIALISVYITQFWQEREIIITFFKRIRSKLSEVNLSEESEILTDSPPVNTEEVA
ncbi:uncharacterized protein LOC143034545 [Oratosquilla oratoria]|uniref:uncharacterized protein LOC143034545 n=1 Tax=Oratosquilla oratoria TaxID=337810 RepID=UPI003F75B5AF